MLNKIDLLPYVDFDLERARNFATKLNKELDIFEVSCRKGDGLEGWYNWLRSMRAAKKEGRLGYAHSHCLPPLAVKVKRHPRSKPGMPFAYIKSGAETGC